MTNIGASYIDFIFFNTTKRTKEALLRALRALRGKKKITAVSNQLPLGCDVDTQGIYFLSAFAKCDLSSSI